MYYRKYTTKFGITKTTTKKGLQSIEDSPSVISADRCMMQWHSKGKLHRSGGPAVVIVASNGHTDYQWWLHGNSYSFKDFIKYTPADISVKAELVMNYG